MARRLRAFGRERRAHGPARPKPDAPGGSCFQSVVLRSVAWQRLWISGVAAVWIASAAAVAADDERETSWPAWRGPDSTGVAGEEANPPVEWSEEKNVRWKTVLPGLGHSSPVVWNQRIYLTTAAPYGEAFEPRFDDAPGSHDNLPVTHRHAFVVLAIDRRTGDILWERPVRRAVPHEGGHYTASLASASPVTDGDRVFALFGSQGLFALDAAGELIWKKSLGRMRSKHGHGEGSSPVLHGDTLAVNWDHEGQSFIAAFDAKTGDERWKVPRDEVTSWASPIVYDHGGVPQLIVSGTARVRSYDLRDGSVRWECGGLSANVVASPVAADGMVFAASSYDTRALLAIRLDGATGDLTGGEHVVWSRRERTPYVPSPLLYRGSLYFLRHYQGILSRVEAKTGAERHRPIRLPRVRSIYASPVAAAGRVYITDRSGWTVVLSHDDEPRILATNSLGDRFSASAAIVESDLILRGEKALYCLSESATPATKPTEKPTRDASRADGKDEDGAQRNADGPGRRR